MGARADLVVVGAGIVGLATASEFLIRRPGARVVVLEKEAEVARHQTGHNSGVVHGGLYYQPGSLKARLCVEGARLTYEYAEQHGIAHERCGKLVVAVRDDELGRLDELERRGVANGVPGLRRLTGAQIGDVEPNAVGVAALHAPNTGIVDYGAIARAIAAELRDQDVEVRLGEEVTAIDDAGVRTEHGSYPAARTIVCAGLWSDRLAALAGAPADPRIVPFRGAYLHLRPERDGVVRGMVYPVPDPDLPFLGVHVTRSIHGGVHLGPTAMLVGARAGYRVSRVDLRDAAQTLAWPGTWRVGRRFWRTGLDEVATAVSRRRFVAKAAHYVPGLTTADLDGTTSAGVRAQAVARDGTLVDDFVLSTRGTVTVVRNAPSPAATSAFALAQALLDRLD